VRGSLLSSDDLLTLREFVVELTNKVRPRTQGCVITIFILHAIASLVLGSSIRSPACILALPLIPSRPSLAICGVMQVVVPAMERRVMALSTQVAQSRKGVKNFVKSLWRTG
jgi:hypothetical protein